jgi:hypothetical protein
MTRSTVVEKCKKLWPRLGPNCRNVTPTVVLHYLRHHLSNIVMNSIGRSARLTGISRVTTQYPTPVHAVRSQSSQSGSKSHNPHPPPNPVSNLGLPLEPQPAPIPTIPRSTLKSADLERLHRLSALDPPTKGSQEEEDLLKGLNELVGLMEVVKGVELPQGKEAIGELLTQGVGEVVIGEHTGGEREGEAVNGRELLQWATRKKGDYYYSKAAKRSNDAE